jgi:hypothetical protein
MNLQNEIRRKSKVTLFTSFGRSRDKQRCDTVGNACKDVVPLENKPCELPLQQNWIGELSLILVLRTGVDVHFFVFDPLAVLSLPQKAVFVDAMLPMVVLTGGDKQRTATPHSTPRTCCGCRALTVHPLSTWPRRRRCELQSKHLLRHTINTTHPFWPLHAQIFSGMWSDHS